MLNRPRPVLQLLAFLSGGFVMGMTVGLVVLFVFHRALQESSYFTLPNVQIVIGLLALSVAVVVAVPGLWDLRPTRLAEAGETTAERALTRGRGSRRSRHRVAVGRLSRRARRHPWPPGRQP